MMSQQIRFCHIAPTNYLQFATKTNGSHLMLAHLVEQDATYRQFYANLSDNKPKILDNSAFELYKQGKDMFPAEKLIDLGKEVNADYIVLPDYPGEPGEKTIEAAKQWAPKFRQAGFKPFFVPQSKIGDLDDYLTTFKWGLQSALIDMIGVSILGVPNAFGVEKDNKLQRYLSRYKLMSLLHKHGLLKNYVNIPDSELNSQRMPTKLHFLGMVDGPNEIELMYQTGYSQYIESWDSSAAVWTALNHVEFDSSPTGLVDGKFEKHVDFDFPLIEPADIRWQIMLNNIRTIDRQATLIYDQLIV